MDFFVMQPAYDTIQGKHFLMHCSTNLSIITNTGSNQDVKQLGNYVLEAI